MSKIIALVAAYTVVACTSTDPDSSGSTSSSGNVSSSSGGNSSSSGSVSSSSGSVSSSSGGNGGSSSGGVVGKCGDTTTAETFLKTNAGQKPVRVDAVGGAMVPFNGTYAILLQNPANPPNRVYVIQLTPEMRQPYDAFAWADPNPANTYANEANEVNLFFNAGVYKAILQCDKTTGIFTLVASNPANAADFVRLKTM